MNNELQHHGIKGQKWGVRRFQNKDGSLTAAGKSRKRNDDTPVHEDHKKAHDKTSVKQMSDKELRDRINRLNMERQYSQLTANEKSAGQKFVTGIVVAVGTQLATEYGKKYAKAGIDALIKKASK